LFFLFGRVILKYSYKIKLLHIFAALNDYNMLNKGFYWFFYFFGKRTGLSLF